MFPSDQLKQKKKSYQQVLKIYISVMNEIFTGHFYNASIVMLGRRQREDFKGKEINDKQGKNKRVYS